jgi:putative transposase
VQAHAVDVLQKNLKLRDHSNRCSASLVFTVLLAAAGQCTSIAAACHRLEKAPSEQTIYNALEGTLPDYTELERRVNRTLRAQLPARLRRRRQRLAIDLTLIPYHGKPQSDLKEIYRGQAKHGTSHFHAYASLYLVCQGQRFTVALTRVELGESMKVVVQRLLGWGRRAGIRPKLLLLDRGFYSVAVISYLKRARVPFLMPAVARGRKPEAGSPATGIRAFRLRKRGGWGEHTLCSDKQRTKVQIAVCCGNYRGQWKRHGRYAWVYAYWGFQPGSLRWVADTYRQRFGIETSYRQMHQGRIKTCTRSPLLRYLYVAIALILRNVWVWLHWEVLSTPRRGRRRLNLQRLTFEGLLVFLVHVAEDLLGFCDRFTAERPPPPTLAAGTS